VNGRTDGLREEGTKNVWEYDRINEGDAWPKNFYQIIFGGRETAGLKEYARNLRVPRDV